MAMGAMPGGDPELEGEGGILSEINITPLVDVMLVLLIIFMVTSSVMSQLGVDVDLPSSSQAVATEQPEGVILTLLPTGEMRINERMIAAEDWETLKDTLSKAFKESSGRMVILEGDRDVLLGSVISIMDHARSAGAEKFAIAASAGEPAQRSRK